MIRKIINTFTWLPHYLNREFSRKYRQEEVRPRHVHFCICDHFEPYANKADGKTARGLIRRWVDEYPRIAAVYPDAEGRPLKYSFFYPEEEYREADLEELAKVCRAGFGEVEIHLHHHNDTSCNLRRTLLGYKHRLHEKHGLLSRDRQGGAISYGFIHGNWALANSRPDGCWCGVNDEIKVLQETGCYADFTMPSAPSDTQTRKVNSIYYAVNNSAQPKSHDWGMDAETGSNGSGLLMVQGPLCLNWKQRKAGILPRIENGGLYGNNPPTEERVSAWIGAGVGINGAREHIFVKIYTHGAQESVMKMLFDNSGFRNMFAALQQFCTLNDIALHYASAREMANTILAIENRSSESISVMRDFRYC